MIKKIILSRPFLRAIARKLTRLYPNGTVAPVRSGVAQGFKWRRYHSQVNGYWRGDYEPQTQEALMLEVNDGDLVFDVGANSGFFALVLSILVKSNGKVVAVDPDPEFVSQIEDVVRLNNLQNVQVEQVALSNYVGEADFSCGCGSKQRFASKTGINTFKTKVNTLDWLASKCGIPDLVMLDVEGAEGDVLEEAKTILSKRKTKFLIETHERENEKGVGIARRLKATFEAYNYDILSLDRTSPVIDMSRHPDILPHHILALPR